MPLQPTPSDVHIDMPLTDLSVAHFQDSANFIASKVFPRVPVRHKSNKYYVWDKNNFHLDSMEKRAPATESAGGGIELSSDSYLCDRWALHKDVDDETRANEDAAVNLETAVTKYLTQQALIRMERQWATDYFATGVWGTEIDGSSAFTQWNNTNSDPENDVLTGKRTILLNGLQEANTLVVSYDVHKALKRHPLIKDRIKYTSSESITEAIIAKFFEVDRYMVAKAVYATNNEGAATDTYDFALGKHALLCHVPPAAGLMIPSPGYTFVWSEANMAGTGLSISRFRMDNIKSDRLEIELYFDMKVVAQDLGYFFLNAVA